jgi:hypothetical protein
MEVIVVTKSFKKKSPKAPYDSIFASLAPNDKDEKSCESLG